jgi:hypothetical protein
MVKYHRASFMIASLFLLLPFLAIHGSSISANSEADRGLAWSSMAPNEKDIQEWKERAEPAKEEVVVGGSILLKLLNYLIPMILAIVISLIVAILFGTSHSKIIKTYYDRCYLLSIIFFVVLFALIAIISSYARNYYIWYYMVISLIGVFFAVIINKYPPN